MAMSAWSFHSWKRPSDAWKPTRLLYNSVNAARRFLIFFFLVGWWKANKVFVKEDLFLSNTQHHGLNVVVTRILYQA